MAFLHPEGALIAEIQTRTLHSSARLRGQLDLAFIESGNLPNFQVLLLCLAS